MSEILTPGAGILFMKVGTHANEPLDEIIARKRKEIDETGYALWGYGGNTCHPLTMVQPFADEHAKAGRPITLCMEPMDSKHFAEQIRANQYSVDGVKWEDIPPTVNAVGSRFALFVKDLREEKFSLPLSETEVAVGRCAGRLGHQYVRGRVDKACLNFRAEDARLNAEEQAKTVQVGLVAELCEPYAAFLRSTN